MVSLKKNPYKSPKIRIFEKIRTKIRTCTDKSIRVGPLNTGPFVSEDLFALSLSPSVDVGVRYNFLFQPFYWLANMDQ